MAKDKDTEPAAAQDATAEAAAATSATDDAASAQTDAPGSEAAAQADKTGEDADKSSDDKAASSDSKDNHAEKPAAGTKGDRPFMHVRISSPFKVFFNGDAFSVSGMNATGPFDILPHHHNFISLLDACELVIRTRTQDERIKISGGIMHVKSDQVIVFLNV